MKCPDPPVHGGGGGFPIGQVLGVALLVGIAAPVIGWVMHFLALILTCLGLAALGCGAGAYLMRRRQHRQALMAGRYVPWMQPAQQHAQFQAQQPPGAVQAGPQLHINLAGASPEVAAEVMRQIRGG